MSERDDYPGTGRPMTTGEFRTTPDASANTAQFRAFAAEQAADDAAPWDMKASGRSVGRLAGIVVLVAIVLAVLALIVVKL
ncbi:MAG TPA: hypothetical protein VFV41_19285 [Streptosporangiaceae bacterium]|nr:hypothetical protein [Streptosporangiaceae bacterium]